MPTVDSGAEPRAVRTVALDEAPAAEELARHWTLSAADLDQVLACRGDTNRRRFAVLLCVLRRCGRFLEREEDIPLRYTNHLAVQMDLDPLLVTDEPLREATEIEYRARIMAHLGFAAFDEAARERLAAELARHAGGGGAERDLRRHAEASLMTWKILAPVRATLERMACSAAAAARETVYDELAVRIPLHMCRAFDELLERAAGESRSSLFRIKQYPDDATVKDMLECLNLHERLVALDLGQIDLSGIDPGLVDQLYQLARRLDAHELKRFVPSKRYALVACFLVETHKTLLDHLVAMHDKLLTDKWRQSRNQFEKTVREFRRRFRKGLGTVREVLEVLSASERPDPEALEALYQHVGVAQFRECLENCREFQRLEEAGAYEEFVRRLQHFRRYLPAFYRLPLRAEPGSEPALSAIRYLRALEEDGRKTLPADAPMDFMPASWRSRVEDEDGALRRHLWEIALALSVRAKLRSGDLFIPGSRDHVSFSNLVYDEKRWESERGGAYVELSLDTEAGREISRLRRMYEAAASAAAAGLAQNPFASVEGDRLKLKRRDELELSESAARLRSTLHDALAHIRIEDLLRIVDSWCGFTAELSPLPGIHGRGEMSREALLATIIAHGTNLGITAMAQSTEGMSVDMLSRAPRLYARPEAIKAANAVLVNFHHRLLLSRVWGDGTASSSDGQRFAVQGRSVLGSVYPRYFGYYDRVVAIYTHTSDQHSVYSTQVISCGPREALYVLDGLLENNTVLRLREHTTDTHGYTEHIFALCHLLGYTFMPRIKDLKDQQLYRVSRDARYGPIDPLFRGTVDLELIHEQWDQLVRLAASLRNRTAPAHIIVQRLARGSSDRLSKALTALGRACKTIHVLRYIQEAQLRDTIQLLLNRGEFRHWLAKCLFFGNHGYFRSGDYEEIMNKASCLSLLSNAVLVWNTVQMQEHVTRLRGAGQDVRDEDLARVSPLAHGHVIPNGTYFFDRPIETESLAANAISRP